MLEISESRLKQELPIMQRKKLMFLAIKFQRSSLRKVLIVFVCLDGNKGGGSTGAAGTGSNMNKRGSKYGDKTEMNFIN